MNSTKEPAISIIMSIYNQKKKEHLEKAIMSILRQSFTDFEFIIYEDGSDNETAAYLQKYKETDERVVLISNPVNHGLAYSLNTCIDVARGKYLARMDDDDISDRNRLKIQYDYMEKHPDVAYVGCNAGLIDSHGVWGYREMPEKPDASSFLKCSPFIHPTVMIRREIFEKSEAYHASKENWRCEDYELFMRLHKLGYKGRNIQQNLFYYREDRDSYAKRKFRYRMNELRLRYRNFRELGILFPFGFICVLRPLIAAAVPGRLIYEAKKLYHRQDMIYERRNLEEERAVSENFGKSPTAV